MARRDHIGEKEPEDNAEHIKNQIKNNLNNPEMIEHMKMLLDQAASAAPSPEFAGGTEEQKEYLRLLAESDQSSYYDMLDENLGEINKIVAGTPSETYEFHTLGEHLQKETITFKPKETVNHPDHYLGDRQFEPIDVINDWNLNFQTGNAVKYISRVGRKGKDIEDLEKAIWYLQYEVKKLKEQPSAQYTFPGNGV